MRHHAAAASPFFGCGWRMAIKGKGTSFTHVRTWIAARASSSSPCSFALGYRFQVHRGPWLSSSRSSSHSSRSTIISITYERIENETICAYVNKMQRPPHTQVVSLITWSSALLDFTFLLDYPLSQISYQVWACVIPLLRIIFCVAVILRTVVN